jgi:hypothetical protein
LPSAWDQQTFDVHLQFHGNALIGGVRGLSSLHHGFKHLKIPAGEVQFDSAPDGGRIDSAERHAHDFRAVYKTTFKDRRAAAAESQKVNC